MSFWRQEDKQSKVFGAGIMQMHPKTAEMESFVDDFRRSETAKFIKAKSMSNPSAKVQTDRGDNSENEIHRKRLGKSRQTEVQMGFHYPNGRK